VRREHDRILPVGLRHRRLEGNVVGNGLVQAENEDVPSVPPVAGEHLPGGNHGQVVVGEPGSPLPDRRQAGKVRGVYERVDPSFLREGHDVVVEHLHVGVDARSRSSHGWAFFVAEQRRIVRQRAGPSQAGRGDRGEIRRGRTGDETARRGNR